MTTYAIVQNAVVVNVIIWDGTAAFTPPNGTQAVAVPSVATVAIGDSYANGSFVAPAVVPPVRTPAQQANVQLAAGVAVAFATSTGLSATYKTTLAAQFKINSEASWLLSKGTFINGATTLALVDASGTPRSFNPAQFAAFEVAYAPYVSALDLVADSNAGTLPAAALTIDA